jgi:hypothetical protein
VTFEEPDLLRYKIDPVRDLLYPDRRFLRLDLSPVVEKHKQDMISQGDEAEDFARLPSWIKVSLFPEKAQAFLHDFYQAIGKGVARLESLALDWQIAQEGLAPRHRYICESTGNRILIEMTFHSCTNKNLKVMSDIYKQANPNSYVIVLCGDRVNGGSFTNADAERKVKKMIATAAKQGKNVMIFASRLGQRSFSIPGLSTVYLCYDQGSEGANRQKMARALTADTLDKVGWIVSCSFNPRGDDKLLPEMLATAKNLKGKSGGSVAQWLKYVITTENICDMTGNGLEVIDTDTWYNYAYESGMISRVLGAMTVPQRASFELRSLLLQAAGYKSAGNDAESSDTGDTFDKNRKPSKPRGNTADDVDKIEAKEIAHMRATLTLLVDTFPKMQIGTGKSAVMDILKEINDDDNHRLWFITWFKMPVEAVFMALDEGVIDESSLEATIEHVLSK